MNRTWHIRDHQRRALVPDILSDVLPPLKDPLTTLSQPLGVITSLIPLPTQPVVTSKSSSDFSHTSASSASPSTSLSSFSTQSTSDSSLSQVSTTPTPIAQSVSSIYETTSGGKVHTLTTFVNATSSTAPSQSATLSPNTFLHNKALSGAIFGLVGLVSLAIIIAIATFAIRRKRNHQLMKEAISFDPSSTLVSAHHYDAEKGRSSTSYSSPRTSDDHNNYLIRGDTFGAPFSRARTEQEVGYTLPTATAATFQGNNRGLKPAPILPNFASVNQSTGTVDEYDFTRNGSLQVTNK